MRVLHSFAGHCDDGVGARDELILLSHDPDSVTISGITRLYLAKEYSPEDARQVPFAIAAKALPDSWKTYFQEKPDLSES